MHEEGVMRVSVMIERVHGALEEYGGPCSMEEVVGLCPELTWNQVYLAIDYLNKTGQVRMTLDPDRTYSVQAYPQAGQRSHDPSRRSPAHSSFS